MTSPNEETVRKLWSIFNSRKFSEVGDLLHDKFTCVWPQSNELIRGKDNLIAMNENYPGEWAVEIQGIFSCGETIISVVKLTFEDTAVFATSIFEFEGKKIVRTIEYWGSTFESPEWRQRWVDKIE